MACLYSMTILNILTILPEWSEWPGWPRNEGWSELATKIEPNNDTEAKRPMADNGTTENFVTTVIAPAVLPDGNGGFTPCPDLLTENEAIRYLRLDVSGPRNPSGTLKYYRDQGVLRAVRIGRNLRYPRKELDSMVEKLLQKRVDLR